MSYRWGEKFTYTMPGPDGRRVLHVSAVRAEAQSAALASKECGHREVTVVEQLVAVGGAMVIVWVVTGLDPSGEDYDKSGANPADGKKHDPDRTQTPA